MRFLTALLILFSLLGQAQAASMVRLDHVTLSAFVETPAKPGATTWVTIRQAIEPGWHTYWRNPGDSGLATSVSWTLPKGITAGAPLWPAPQRFLDGSIVNYGYAGQATLLVPIRTAPGAAIGMVHARVFLLECQHMCIPEQAVLDIDLRKASGTPELFTATRSRIPKPFPGSVHIESDAKHVTVTLTGAPVAGVQADGIRLYPVTQQAVDNDASPAVEVRDNTLVWKSSRPPHAKPFTAFAGVVTLRGKGNYRIASPVSVPAVASAGAATASSVGVLGAIFFAFLGGLILNLMPCVFPILSMKALSLAQSGGNAHAARRDGAFYFVGVLATFSLIAGALLALRAGGMALGWGFQLQSPYVVLVLFLLMTAVGLNLLGAFELPFSLAGLGNGLAGKQGGLGAFFTGVLAVLVASPCTAPFMGTALGFALTQPSSTAVLVFLALGVGFALPFSVLSFTPTLVRLIPRPGAWMVRFRQFLAFPMLATAIWLLWVLDLQAGATGMVVALAVVLGLVFLFWLTPLVKAPLRIFVMLGGLASLLFAATNIHGVQAHATGMANWVQWSPQAVQAARRSGRPVLVDFSAAWCVTCLVNEHVALDNTRVVTQLKKDRVATFHADWTDRNPAIAAELSRYGRSGVPLYVLYPPQSGGKAIILPQILTPETVLTALRRIEG